MRTITSIKDPVYAHMSFLSKSSGKDTGEVIIDGIPLLEAAIQGNCPVVSVLWDEREINEEYSIALNKLLEPHGAEIACASHHLLRRLEVGMGAPKCIFVVKKHIQTVESANELAGLERILMPVEVADPSNLGMILRSAEAFGYAVVTCGDSASLLSRPCIRSSTGSAFRLKLRHANVDPVQLVKDLNNLGFQTISSSAHGKRLLHELEWRSPRVILVGNETHGLSLDVRSVTTDDVIIPMVKGGVHSLNVAVSSSILMYAGRSEEAAEP